MLEKNDLMIPFSVQHPNSLTTFGCGSSSFIIASSWRRSRFSDSDALAFNILTATVVDPIKNEFKNHILLCFQMLNFIL